ncbi:MAG: phosphoenolpyruvate synthase, partial [Bacteroidales bacterium]
KTQKRTYVLVGPGRWGSSDPWLGIPINWNHISEARLIVECGLKHFQVDPSQGTHFFHNLTSLGIGYLTVYPFREDGIFNETLLESLPGWYEGNFVRAVSFPQELVICADGKIGKGVVMTL